MSEEFSGKVIWVVGATGALGEDIVNQLTSKGATVIASSRQIEGKGAPVLGIHPMNVDVTRFETTEMVAQRIVKDHGGIDGLVVTTTLPIFGDFMDLGDAEWEAVLETKMMGTIRLIRAVVPSMQARGGGSIVALSGGGGINPSLRHLPGSVANAGINLVVKGLAKRFGPDQIRINVVSPGPIESPRLEAIRKAKGPSTKTPLGGAGEPADVSNAVVFLLSSKAKYITGANLAIDGGGRLEDPK